MTTVGIVTGAGRGMGLACAGRLAGLVDTLLLVDRDEAAVTAAAAASTGATVEPVVLDITDRDGLARLAARVSELGTLRAVAHAAGISPTMADWRRIFTVDLIGTALLAEALRPLATAGTAMVCFASMAPLLAGTEPDPAVAAILDAPLDEQFLDRIYDALGPEIENTGLAYAWAKHGVHRFVRQEAVRLGPAGARICSVSPGIIDTPQGQQEAASHPSMEQLLRRTPLRRAGQPEEVAAVVSFLLSAEASFLTGIDVLIDGGVYAAVRSQGGPTLAPHRYSATHLIVQVGLGPAPVGIEESVHAVPRDEHRLRAGSDRAGLLGQRRPADQKVGNLGQVIAGPRMTADGSTATTSRPGGS